MTTTTGRMSKEEEREREKITPLIAATKMSRWAHAFYWKFWNTLLFIHPVLIISTS